MIRIVRLTDYRMYWFGGILVPLALAACGGGSKQPVTTDQVQASPTTRAIPAGGPAGSTGSVTVTPPAPRVPTFEEAESVYKEGRFAEARELFTSYVASKPDNAFGYYMLGLASWKSGDFAAAERAFETAIEKDPTHVKSLLNSARVLMDLGRDHEALERLQVAASLDSTSSEVVRLEARARQRLGDIDAAVGAYRRALVLNEEDSWAMNNLGTLYLDQQDPKSSLGPFARAVELRPGSAIFQNNLGMALELTGHINEAKRAYGAAVKADSSYAKAVANARRTGEIVDSPVAGVNVKDFAELFRQQVRMWRDSVPTPPLQ